ncbi:Uncharacterised protein [Candidatus Gugararchaeum adminiculabundum]|nr:Uncharacterised protein [Candidatus Gugararchaeum adminiculabundum]
MAKTTIDAPTDTLVFYFKQIVNDLSETLQNANMATGHPSANPTSYYHRLAKAAKPGISAMLELNEAAPRELLPLFMEAVEFLDNVTLHQKVKTTVYEALQETLAKHPVLAELFILAALEHSTGFGETPGESKGPLKLAGDLIANCEGLDLHRVNAKVRELLENGGPKEKRRTIGQIFLQLSEADQEKQDSAKRHSKEDDEFRVKTHNNRQKSARDRGTTTHVQIPPRESGRGARLAKGIHR